MVKSESGDKFATAKGAQEPSLELAAKKLKELVAYARAQGKKPVFVSSTPRNGKDSSRCLEMVMSHGLDLSQCDMSRISVDKNSENQVALSLMQQVEKMAPVIYLHDFLCDEKVCQAHIDNYPLYVDAEGHLTTEGSKRMGQKIDLFGLVKHYADNFSYPENNQGESLTP